MNISKYLLVAGALTLLPSFAFADRYWGGHQNFSRPSWSNNNLNRPFQNNYGNYGYNNYNGRNNANSLISSGIQSGRLSNAEVRELREKQRDIWQDQRSAWSDGRLSKDERKDIRGDYKDFYKDLNHELNDGERRNYRSSFWNW